MLLKSLRRILAAIGALYILVTVTPIDRWWTNLLTGPIYDPKGDVLILLGADAFPDVMGYGSYLRAVYGVRVWRSGGIRQVFISGGRGTGGVASALMRDFMAAEGVPQSAITIETASVSTRENALFTTRMLEKTPGRKILMTSDYHAFRAWRAFRKAGLDVELCSFPDNYKFVSSWWNRWGVFIGLCMETTKIGYYRARVWI